MTTTINSLSTIRSLAQVLLISLSAATLFSCHMNDTADELPSSSASAAVFETGVPGGVRSNVTTVTALVTAVDYKKRSVTLKNDQGEKRTLNVGPAATNFNKIKTGDHVTVEVAEEIAVYMRDKNAPNNDGAAGIVAQAAPGEKPAVLLADTLEVTAVVKAVDLAKHTATLQFADGSTKTVAVRPDVVLNKNQIGHQVVFRMTTAMAVTVDTSN
jgi:hypothetical protein